MNNYIYEGTIRHRRFTPFNRSFKYNTFMTFFDVSTIDSIFKKSFLWNINKFGLVSYYRKDYHGDIHLSLEDAVRKTVKNKTGIDTYGPIRVLTHLRYFGYCFNPVTFYYIYNKDDSDVELIMAEVTNTPWNERHSYFILNKSNKLFRQKLKKEFHVSPFWDMDHDYEWFFSTPQDNISVNMINYKNHKKIFDATLNLKKVKKLTFRNLLLYTFRFPFITLGVFLKIHFQAFILLVKGATFYNHPKYNSNKNEK